MNAIKATRIPWRVSRLARDLSLSSAMACFPLFQHVPRQTLSGTGCPARKTHASCVQELPPVATAGKTATRGPRKRPCACRERSENRLVEFRHVVLGDLGRIEVVEEGHILAVKHSDGRLERRLGIVDRGL